MITRLGSLFARIHVNRTWALFDEYEDATFVRMRRWGYCLRLGGMLVAEDELRGTPPVPMLMYLERYTLEEQAIAAGAITHLLTHYIRPRVEFDHFELVTYSRWLPPAPNPRIVRGFDREVIVSCAVRPPASSLDAAATIPQFRAMA